MLLFSLKYLPHLSEIPLSCFMAFGEIDPLKMPRIFMVIPYFPQSSRPSDQDRETNRCHTPPNRQRLESVLLPGILVSWKHLDSPRCPLNEPFASLHVLGVYMDWALIPVFCLVLQFLESQVGLMMYGAVQ